MNVVAFTFHVQSTNNKNLVPKNGSREEYIISNKFQELKKKPPPSRASPNICSQPNKLRSPCLPDC